MSSEKRFGHYLRFKLNMMMFLISYYIHNEIPLITYFAISPREILF